MIGARDGLPRLEPIFPKDKCIGNTKIDIIAVHGIETRSPKTWTAYEQDEEPKGRAINWLCEEDMLPKIIPSARIWVYDYNSNCYSDNAQQVDVLGLGNIFLESLWIAQDQGVGRRPLLFIGSCFGGIVVTQALERADRDRSHKYDSLLKATAGIVYLGTPFRGTTTANTAQLLVWLRGIMGKETSKDLLRTLEDSGSGLDTVVHDFTEMANRRNLQIRCFFETRETQIANAVVKRSLAKLIQKIMLVSKQSACLDGHKRFALDVRHAMLNKFRGPRDSNFVIITNILKELADNAHVGTDLTQTELDCLQSLTSDYRADKDRNEQRVPGTCQWLLTHHKFLGWRATSRASLLWVSADPGCGKSVLSRALIDEGLLTLDPEQASICYFFFKDDDTNRRSGASALRAILHQLFVQKPTLLKHAMSSFRENGKNLPNMYGTMWDIFKNAAEDPDAGEIVCIIDALDECQEASAQDLIGRIGRSYLNESREKSSLKFLITSRPYHDIENEFSSVIQDMESISLRGEEESETISKEIYSVIPNRIQRISDARKHPFEPGVKKALIEWLQNMQNQTYLWLHLILDTIRKSLDSTRFRLERLIHSLPRTAEDAYEKILKRVEERGYAPQARRLLQIVVAAERPLEVREVNIAFTIDEMIADGQSCRSFEGLQIEPEAPFRDKIRDLCGLFVSIKDAKLYLIHQTAREFLVSKAAGLVITNLNLSKTPTWRHSISTAESNLVLARICIFYLMPEEFDSIVLCEWPKERLLYGDRPVSGCELLPLGLLHYAAEHGSAHFRQAKIQKLDEATLQSTLKLCDTESTRFWNWYSLYFCEGWRCCSPSTHLTVACCLGLELIVKLLLEHQYSGLDLDLDSRAESLLGAASHGLAELTRLLLEKDGTKIINSRDDSNRTPLWFAAAKGHVELVKLLLDQKGAELNCKSSVLWCETPLSRAIRGGKVEVVKLLLSHESIEVNSKDYSGCTPFQLAVKRGNVEIIRLLLEKEKCIELNGKDSNGTTPLHIAATAGDADVVQLLLETKGIELNVKDRDGRTPLSLAVRSGHVDVVKLLLEHGVESNSDPDANSGRMLLSQASKRRTETVELLHIGSPLPPAKKRRAPSNSNHE